METHGRQRERAPDPRKLITSIQGKDVTPSDEAFVRKPRQDTAAGSLPLVINKMIFTAND